MTLQIVIFSLVVVGVILSVLFGWKISIKNKGISLYWVIALVGAVVCLCTGCVSWESLYTAFFTNTAVNPLKILVLFLSMTLISVFLDEAGFYSYLAAVAVKRAGASQIKLFIILYVLTSVLTVFTSNDVIILTFTPFILYFCKNSKIDPVPYLVSEFVAANTWSMFFIFGNPTNVYIASAFSLGFIEYFQGMWLSTVCSGVVSFALLLLLFHKKLKVTPTVSSLGLPAVDKTSSAIGLSFLGVCIIALAVSSYVGLEMWLVALVCAVGCMLVATIYRLVKRIPLTPIKKTFCNLPYPLIPFLISMFILILSLQQAGVAQVGKYLPDNLFSYGALSFLGCNILNNIPMSVLFCALLQEGNASLSSVFSVVVGSNLGAVFTPIGALAGIMWMNIVRSHEVKFSFLRFVKYGCMIGLPTLGAALLGLWLLA